MKIKLLDLDIDLNNEIDLHFLHEKILYIKYLNLRNIESSDIYTKIYRKEVEELWLEKALTGSWHSNSKKVYRYDDDKYENVSEDFTMCWKKTDKDFDKLIINLTSYAGHDGRLTSSLTNVSDKIYNLDTDLLIVNEDPLRFPESLYPSAMVLGCSDKNNTQEKMCNQIREYIKKKYRHVIIYADSKHAGSAVSIAYELSDIVTNVLTTGGQTTYSWEHSPWIKSYMKWHDRPEHLKDQNLIMLDVAMMHLVKCWGFKKLDINNKTLDPYRYLGGYPNIKVDYLYGKYDTDYSGFTDYVKQFDFENLCVTEIDYKISDHQNHNIRPYVDRKILKDFIYNLPDSL